MTNTASILTDRLATITSERPDVIRTQVVGAIRAAVTNEAGVFFNCVTRNEQLHYGQVIVAGEQPGEDDLPAYAERPLVGQSVVGRPVSGASCPAEKLDFGPVNRFVRVTAPDDDARMLSRPIVTNVLQSPEVEDQLRAVLFDGPSFLGWLGLIRRGEGERFCIDEEQILAGATPQIRSALAAAQALEDEQLECGAYGVYTPQGAVEYASSGFSNWLDPRRSAFISSWAQGFDAGTDQAAVKLLEGAELRLVRLDGSGGVRYLATLGRAELLKLSPTYCLTPRQREVAECAAAGATNAEIAKHLGISAETVKTHIKHTYDRLGVSNRLELSQMLAHPHDSTNRRRPTGRASPAWGMAVV